MTALSPAVTVALLAGVALWLWRRRCLSLVAQAGHELRGPLQAALLGLHGLEDPGDGARLAAIELELRRAARAVEDLSAAASGRRAAGTVAGVELGALLADAAAAWELIAAHRGVALIVEPPSAPLVVRADELRIAQVLANLVANAVEHGGGDVCVRARATAGRARIEVTDGGPGLPAPLSDLVAACRGRRDRRGHGLALAAVIARRQGGRLVTAPSPRGARLVLELPLAGAELADGRARHAVMRRGARAATRSARLRRRVPAPPFRRWRRQGAPVVPLRTADGVPRALRRAR